jgi:hypothetical protein
MSDPMKWQRIKVAAPASKKDRQPSTVFRAKAPSGWFVAFDWGNGISETLHVPGDEWDVELEAEENK